MKLTTKQQEYSDFVDSLKKSTVGCNKVTLKKLLKIYSSNDTKFIDEEEGGKLLPLFISKYEFKNSNDYISVLDLIKAQEYFDSGQTLYNVYGMNVTMQLFNSSFIKPVWMIEHMVSMGSFAEINNIIKTIFYKATFITDDSDKLKFLRQIVDYVDGMKKSIIVYEAIVRFGITKKIDGLSEIFETMFKNKPEIEILSIQNAYDSIVDDQIRVIVGKFLYMRTGEPKYLSKEVQDIFIF